MEKSKNELILDILKNEQIRYLFLVSLISSDNILTIEDAEANLARIDEVETAVNAGDLSDELEKEIRKYIKDGRKILNQDIESFKNSKSN